MESRLAIALLALSLVSFCGCANQTSATASSASNPTRRTYSQDELSKTGRTQTGEALQAIDPSVGLSGSPR